MLKALFRVGINDLIKSCLLKDKFVHCQAQLINYALWLSFYSYTVGCVMAPSTPLPEEAPSCMLLNKAPRRRRRGGKVLVPMEMETTVEPAASWVPFFSGTAGSLRHWFQHDFQLCLGPLLCWLCLGSLI